LFISRLGEIKLGDFGIAKVRSLGDGGPGRTLWGKLAYLAPEATRAKAALAAGGSLGRRHHPLRSADQPARHRGRQHDEMQDALRAGRIAGIESLRPTFPPAWATWCTARCRSILRRAIPPRREFLAALEPFHDEISGGALGIASSSAAVQD